MTQDITYRLAENGDLEKIKGLLTRAELPVDDINASKIDFAATISASTHKIFNKNLSRCASATSTKTIKVKAHSVKNPKLLVKR